MIRIGSSQPFPPSLRGAVIALGNFDGFHAGHQAVVAQASGLARTQRRPLIVATFAPHPVKFFRPASPSFALTDLDQREALFARAGSDAMLVFEFNAAMAQLSADDFVGKFLVETCGIAGIVTGSGFRFGRLRHGNAALLEQIGARRGLSIAIVDHLIQAGEPVSSSRIRAALGAGNCAEAAALLTRPFAVRGKPVAGPTQDSFHLDIGDYICLRSGEYEVRCRSIDNDGVRGMARVIETQGRQMVHVLLPASRRMDLAGAIEIDFIAMRSASPADIGACDSALLRVSPTVG